MIDPHQATSLKPTTGTINGKSLRRFTPIQDCLKEECPLFQWCPYVKKGVCGLEREYLNPIYEIYIRLDDELTELDLCGIDELMSLQHQLIKLKKVEFLIFNPAYTDGKGVKRIHPIFREIREVIHDIDIKRKSLKLNEKWERKFGTKMKTVSQDIKRKLSEKGDPGYYETLLGKK